MKNFVSSHFQNFALVFCFLLLCSCQKENIQDAGFDALDAKSEKAKTEAYFPTFHQNFNHNTAAWSDQTIEGVLGWCGNIELQNKWDGEVKPSASRGFATVMQGDCNEFWTSNPEAPANFSTGAPTVQDPALWSSTWPESGFVQDLDIYLDADMFETGLAFMYASSIKTREGIAFDYFAVSVVDNGASLSIQDHNIAEEGWYTFRFYFHSENIDGEEMVAVDFKLIKDGQPEFSTTFETSLLGTDVSSLNTGDYGSGYVYFVSIAEGVALPIDEYFIRPGK